MKVYAVSTGSYSDYSVAALFTDRALAEAHQAELDSANEVEEFELLDEAPTQFTVYSISNDTYRGPGVDHEWSYVAWSYNRRLYKRVEVTEYGTRHGRLAIRVHGWDQEAVRQAYRDRKARHATQEAGIA